MRKFTELSSNLSPEDTIRWIKRKIINGEDLSKLTKSALREKIEQLDGPKFVDANFENRYSRPNVLVKTPPSNDQCLRVCPKHFCLIPKGKNLSEGIDIVIVPEHYRRTLTIENGTQIYRNFYTTDVSLLGEAVVADLTFQIKTDLSSGKETIILNYENIRDKKSCRATHTMKIGTDAGQIPIPGSKKFIKITKI
ncbi:MAG: hypothetical protein Q8N57_03415 [bacterium]|nr:hypothetical protein [bacterium]